MPHIPSDLYIPIALFVGGVVAYVLAARRAARPPNPNKPRMLPWRFLSLCFAFVAFIGGLYILQRVGLVPHA